MICFCLLRLPWNQKTPIGFSCAFATNLFVFVVLLHTLVCSLCLLIGFFVIMMTFAGRIQTKFHDLNEMCRAKKCDKIKNLNQFCNVIRFHAEVKELSVQIFHDYRC